MHVAVLYWIKRQKQKNKDPCSRFHSNFFLTLTVSNKVDSKKVYQKTRKMAVSAATILQYNGI